MQPKVQARDERDQAGGLGDCVVCEGRRNMGILTQCGVCKCTDCGGSLQGRGRPCSCEMPNVTKASAESHSRPKSAKEI